MLDNFPEDFSNMMEPPLNSGNLPDEVVVMPTESFLKEITKQLENTPFVALNVTRSIVLRPVDNQPGYTTVTIMGVGFEMEEVNSLPDFMHMLTGKEEILVTAETDELKAVIENAIKEYNNPSGEASLTIPQAENTSSSIMEF